jgi:hypothetical protein
MRIRVARLKVVYCPLYIGMAVNVLRTGVRFANPVSQVGSDGFASPQMHDQ